MATDATAAFVVVSWLVPLLSLSLSLTAAGGGPRGDVIVRGAASAVFHGLRRGGAAARHLCTKERTATNGTQAGVDRINMGETSLPPQCTGSLLDVVFAFIVLVVLVSAKYQLDCYSFSAT